MIHRHLKVEKIAKRVKLGLVSQYVQKFVSLWDFFNVLELLFQNSLKHKLIRQKQPYQPWPEEMQAEHYQLIVWDENSEKRLIFYNYNSYYNAASIRVDLNESI